MTNDEIVLKTKEEFMLRGLSKNTLESYLLALQSFTRFYGDQPIESMGEREIRKFLLHLIELNKSSDTINIKTVI